MPDAFTVKFPLLIPKQNGHQVSLLNYAPFNNAVRVLTLDVYLLQYMKKLEIPLTSISKLSKKESTAKQVC